MKYFYDTEFIEDGRTIDLISIGVVAEDGREFYAVSREFDARRANSWVQRNVLNQLPDKGDRTWMSKDQLRKELLRFLLNGKDENIDLRPEDKPELWAWVGAYDHVALAQLWGDMRQLPQQLPRFTHELKQFWEQAGSPELPRQSSGNHDALEDARFNELRYRISRNHMG